MGIGDWAQSPIPNPQSPYNKFHYLNKKLLFLLFKKLNQHKYYLKIIIIIFIQNP